MTLAQDQPLLAPLPTRISLSQPPHIRNSSGAAACPVSVRGPAVSTRLCPRDVALIASLPLPELSTCSSSSSIYTTTSCPPQEYLTCSSVGHSPCHLLCPSCLSYHLLPQLFRHEGRCIPRPRHRRCCVTVWHRLDQRSTSIAERKRKAYTQQLHCQVQGPCQGSCCRRPSLVGQRPACSDRIAEA